MDAFDASGFVEVSEDNTLPPSGTEMYRYVQGHMERMSDLPRHKREFSDRDMAKAKLSLNALRTVGWTEFLQWFTEDMSRWRPIEQFIKYLIVVETENTDELVWAELRTEIWAWSVACFYYHHNNTHVSEIVEHPVTFFYLMNRFVFKMPTSVCS